MELTDHDPSGYLSLPTAVKTQCLASGEHGSESARTQSGYFLSQLSAAEPQVIPPVSGAVVDAGTDPTAR